MKNFSRQREAILTALRSTTCHPTASWVYNEVRKHIPNISLGTVYRNLSALEKAGEILCISVNDGVEHYDGDISPHVHLHCRCCGKIDDAMLSRDISKEVATTKGFIADSSIYVVYGTCSECDKNEKTSIN